MAILILHPYFYLFNNKNQGFLLKHTMRT